MSGLLNLEGIESKNNNNDDILSANINEDVSIPVPGGLSDKPSGTPKDVSIPIPSSTTLTDKQYKDALSSLQKSFKEGVELLGNLLNSTVVEESVDYKQEQFVEAQVEQAIIESYLNGPIFEAVDRTDKESIKKIIKDIKKDVVKEIRHENLEFYELGWWTKLKSKFNFRNFGQHFLWQFIGIFEIETQNASDFCKQLTKKFEDELGEYKILCYQCVGFSQLFDFKNLKSKLAGDTKNVRASFVLFVDRKMEHELKKELDLINKEIEAKLKSKEDDKKD